ncbi:uncharacterized protein [Periplaneta americana]|uniref:uncharacterized protein isoform X1 n=1 Tax=Periplaneta americana TaxID=6978 RepID=UPI0037E97463
MALQQTLLAALLVLSVTTAENAETSQVAYIQDKTDVRNNLTESHGHTVASSRTIHGAQDSLTDNTTTVPKSAQARSFSISSIFEGSKGEEEKETPPADGEALPLNKHPLWRVHKYQGIDIRPVPLPTAQYGPPPPQPVESYGPPPVPSPEAPGDTSAALSALDNLSGLANLLPQEGSSGGSLLSVLGSLSSPPQKKGLSPEQLSALASLANLIKQKSPREPASEYGPPSPGVDLSTLASLASLLPQQGDSSLLSTVQSILSKKPAFISSLINTLKLFSPSNSEESEGASVRYARYLSPNNVIVESLTGGDLKGGGPKPNKQVADSKIGLVKDDVKVGILHEHDILEDLGKTVIKKPLKAAIHAKGHVVSKLLKLGKFGLKKKLLKHSLKTAVLKAPFAIKKHIVSKLAKVGKFKVAKTVGKLAIVKALILTKIKKLVKFGILKAYIPLKLVIGSAVIKGRLIYSVINLAKDLKRVKYAFITWPLKKIASVKFKKLKKEILGLKGSFPLIVGAGVKNKIISKFEEDSKFVIGGDAGTGSKLKNKKSTSRTGRNILSAISNFFLGTAPEAEPNLLELPELPPISIPPNFKFQETGVKQPYVIKYSSSAAPTEYGPPEPSLPYPPASPPPYPPPSSPPYPPPSLQPYPPPVYGPPQVAPYPPSVPSTYGPPPISTYGVPQEPAAFYLPKVSPQQHSPSIAFPNSQPENSPINSQNPPPEPRFPVNSYGQPTLSYNIADSQPSSEFRSDSHEHFIDSNAGHSATDVSLKTDLVPQQSQESVNALRYSLERGASYSDSSNHVQGGPYFGNSRSDTTLPSEPFSNESDFKPSTLAAATGSGYSRVVFQRAQQMVKEEATQGREPDHSAPRSTSNLQNNEQSRSATAASSEDSEEARLHSETGDFHSGYR